MNQNKITTSELFETIKEGIFPDVDVMKVVDMTESEQSEFTMKLVDNLIERRIKFYDMFYTAEEGRMQKDYNPCLDPMARDEMNEDEKQLCKFYLDIAGLCHDLWCHYEFDPMDLGIKTDDEEFFVSNEPLTEWVLTSQYRKIALMIALTMKKKAVELMEEVGYREAEKYLAKLDNKSATAIINGLKAVDHHLEEGLNRGMTHEEIFMHDARHGKFMTEFV